MGSATECGRTEVLFLFYSSACTASIEKHPGNIEIAFDIFLSALIFAAHLRCDTNIKTARPTVQTNELKDNSKT